MTFEFRSNLVSGWVTLVFKTQPPAWAGVGLLTSGTGALNKVSPFLILDLPLLVRPLDWKVHGGQWETYLL